MSRGKPSTGRDSHNGKLEAAEAESSCGAVHLDDEDLLVANANMRHNPHPHRCVHICALHGCHVPCVVDDGMPVDFQICYPTARPEQLKSAAANPSSLSRLVDPRHVEAFKRLSESSNGKQESKGTEGWRDALASLARETFNSDAFGVGNGTGDGGWQTQAATAANPHLAREAQRLYSPLTGRLISGDAPAGSKSPANGRQSYAATAVDVVSPSPLAKSELLQSSMMSMLCRILQTSDQRAVRAWLTMATPRERQLVTDIIRSSIANKDEYYLASPLAVLPQRLSISRGSLAPPASDVASLFDEPERRSGTGCRSSVKSLPATRDSKRGTTPDPTAATMPLRGSSIAGSSEKRERQSNQPQSKQKKQQPVCAAGRKTQLPAWDAGGLELTGTKKKPQCPKGREAKKH